MPTTHGTTRAKALGVIFQPPDDVTILSIQIAATPPKQQTPHDSQKDTQSTNTDNLASSQPKEKQRIPPIKFPDYVLGAFLV